MLSYMPANDMPRVYLALGSNLGDRQRFLSGAVSALAGHPAVRVTRQSGLYETEPVGGPIGQGLYLNAVVEVGTPLAPDELLALAQAIEDRMGRHRVEIDGPRTVDIDVLLYGETIIDRLDLKIPHPRMSERRFVLEPLVEIAADVVHPVSQRTMRGLLDALPSDEANPQSCRRIDDRSWAIVDGG